LAAVWRGFTGWLGDFFGTGKVMAAPLPVKAERAKAAIAPPPAGQVWKNYIFAGSERVAVRTYENGSVTGTINFLLSDHLGSLSVVAPTPGGGDGSERESDSVDALHGLWRISFGVYWSCAVRLPFYRPALENGNGQTILL
jgi:hypothetical protein